MLLKEVSKLNEWKKKNEQKFMSQLLLINTSLARISSAVYNNSKQLESILAIDRCIRALAMPVSELPSPFIGLLPIKSFEDLQ